MNTLSITHVASGLCLAFAVSVASANPVNSATAAPATQAKQNVFTLLTNTKITLDDAIKAAEKSVSGSLIGAELSREGSPSYRVVLADTNSRTLTFVKVDASNGKILSSRVTHPDNRGVVKTKAIQTHIAAPPAAAAHKAALASGAKPVSGNPLKSTSATPAAPASKP